MKNKLSCYATLYDAFFDSYESKQYVDLKKRFDEDFEKNVLFEGYNFTKEGWFKSTVASALNHYFNSFNSEVLK